MNTELAAAAIHKELLGQVKLQVVPALHDSIPTDGIKVVLSKLIYGVDMESARTLLIELMNPMEPDEEEHIIEAVMSVCSEFLFGDIHNGS